jgi:hypothetical protein
MSSHETFDRHHALPNSRYVEEFRRRMTATARAITDDYELIIRQRRLTG